MARHDEVGFSADRLIEMHGPRAAAVAERNAANFEADHQRALAAHWREVANAIGLRLSARMRRAG
jgi:hypothetical protein